MLLFVEMSEKCAANLNKTVQKTAPFFLQMLRATRAAILSESPDNGEDVGIERATPFKPPPRAKYLTIATTLGLLSNSPRGYVL